MAIVKKMESTIGGVPYKMTTFTASEGLMMYPKIITVLGHNALNLIMSTTDDQRNEMLTNKKIAAGLLLSVCASAEVSERGLLVLKDLMVKVTSTKLSIGEGEGEGSLMDHFDSHFTGRMGHLIEVVMWVMQENFSEL
jgi:hypothetical protein